MKGTVGSGEFGKCVSVNQREPWPWLQRFIQEGSCDPHWSNQWIVGFSKNFSKRLLFCSGRKDSRSCPESCCSYHHPEDGTSRWSPLPSGWIREREREQTMDNTMELCEPIQSQNLGLFQSCFLWLVTESVLIDTEVKILIGSDLFKITQLTNSRARNSCLRFSQSKPSFH